MKILKPGKVEQRKFVCPKCGCVFAESKTKMFELSYGFRVTCPQEECGYEFTDYGEPYEEPVEDNRERLMALLKETQDVKIWHDAQHTIADYRIANGLNFREG